MTKHQEIINKDVEQIVLGIGGDVGKLSGATVLITGPNGLLASYIADTIAYLNDNNILINPCKVIGLQRSGVDKKSRLGHLLDRDDFEFVAHDVINEYKLPKDIDYIIHAAGRSAPATFQSDPLGTVDVNIKAIRWLLEYAKENTVKSFLYMSSGETYGSPTPDNIPTPETYTGNVSPLAPRACYTESKRLSETLCSIYHSKFEVPIKVARPFIVYGPGLPIEDRRVMADFMRSGINKKPIQMLSEGLDTRSYCYITDATVLFFKMLFSDQDGQAFNVANDGGEISIRGLADMVHEICGIRKAVTVKKSANKKFISDAPSRVCPDITKARLTFNYSPEIDLKEGLTRTIEWNKAFYKIG